MTACSKQRYPNRKAARKAGRAVRWRLGRSLSAYECKWCSAWHLTTTIAAAIDAHRSGSKS